MASIEYWLLLENSQHLSHSLENLLGRLVSISWINYWSMTQLQKCTSQILLPVQADGINIILALQCLHSSAPLYRISFAAGYE